MVEGKLRKLSQCTSAFLAALGSVVTGITTALYTFAQELNASSVPALSVTSTGTNQDAELNLKPSGTAAASKLRLYTSDPVDSAKELSIVGFDTGAEIALSGADLTDDLLINISGNAGLKSWVLSQAGKLTLPGALIFNAADVFLSAEITGNGGAQNTAHGLGRTPVIAIAYFTKVAAAGDVLSAVTSDDTNCTVTGTTNAMYRILAF